MKNVGADFKTTKDAYEFIGKLEIVSNFANRNKTYECQCGECSGLD